MIDFRLEPIMNINKISKIKMLVAASLILAAPIAYTSITPKPSPEYISFADTPMPKMKDVYSRFFDDKIKIPHDASITFDNGNMVKVETTQNIEHAIYISNDQKRIQEIIESHAPHLIDVKTFKGISYRYFSTRPKLIDRRKLNVTDDMGGQAAMSGFSIAEQPYHFLIITDVPINRFLINEYIYIIKELLD